MPIQKRIANPKTNENYFRGHLYTEFAYFEDGFRAATAASLGAPSLMVVPSDCAMLLRSRRTKDGGIIREMFLSMRVRLSPPRTMFSFVENCPYLSGGRKARKGKRGQSNLKYTTFSLVQDEHKTA